MAAVSLVQVAGFSGLDTRSAVSGHVDAAPAKFPVLLWLTFTRFSARDSPLQRDDQGPPVSTQPAPTSGQTRSEARQRYPPSTGAFRPAGHVPNAARFKVHQNN